MEGRKEGKRENDGGREEGREIREREREIHFTFFYFCVIRFLYFTNDLFSSCILTFCVCIENLF